MKMRIARDPTALAEARQVGGMCVTELVQLANAACGALGISYPFGEIEQQVNGPVYTGRGGQQRSLSDLDA